MVQGNIAQQADVRPERNDRGWEKRVSIVTEERAPTARVTYAHPLRDGRSRHALLTRSAVPLLHSRMKVEDVPVRITYVEGAMAPRLGRQLLDPRDLEAFES